MCFVGDMTFYFAIFVDEFDGTICKPDCCHIAGSFGERHPIVFDGVGVEFQPFGGSARVDIPFVDDVVLSDADYGECYLVTSLKEHHETEVHISSCLVCPPRPLILNLI